MATMTRVPTSVHRHCPLPVMNSHPMKKSAWFMPVGVKSLMLIITPQHGVNQCLIPFAPGAEPGQHILVQPEGNLFLRFRKLDSYSLFPPRIGPGGFRVGMTVLHSLVLAHAPVRLTLTTAALSFQLFRR